MDRQPGALTLSEDDRRVLAVWAADCAERALPLFEARVPSDSRPREAIEGLRAFARGEMRIGPVRSLAARAHAAAREIRDPAAVAAARAAGQAAGVAHMAAHARGAAAYAAKAAGLAATHDPTAVADEARWQLRHASPAVRDVLGQLPPPIRPAGADNYASCVDAASDELDPDGAGRRHLARPCRDGERDPDRDRPCDRKADLDDPTGDQRVGRLQRRRS